MRQSLEGIFEEEKCCQVFEGLLDLASYKRNITELTEHELRRWLRRMREEMADDGRQMARFSKTFYGFVYFKPDGTKAQGYQRLPRDHLSPPSNRAASRQLDDACALQDLLV